MNTDQFNKNFIDDKTKQNCVIEIYKDHCGACAYASKVFDALSHKFDLHGYDVGMVRMKIENSLPFVGQTPFSPMYLLVKKNDQGSVSEIKCLQGPLKGGNKFIKEIETNLGLPGLSDKVQIHNRAQMGAWLNGSVYNDDFDIEFDTKLEDTAKE